MTDRVTLRVPSTRPSVRIEVEFLANDEQATVEALALLRPTWVTVVGATVQGQWLPGHEFCARLSRQQDAQLMELLAERAESIGRSTP